MNTQQDKVFSFIESLKLSIEKDAFQKIAEFLQLDLIFNPVNPSSDWMLLSHPKMDNDVQALMALKYEENLDAETSVSVVRKLYDQVTHENEEFGQYNVDLFAFVGVGRIVIFRSLTGNRDERLDISLDSVSRVSLYADAFLSLHKDKIQLQRDEFGFGDQVTGLDNLFRRELSSIFNNMVSIYRKKIAQIMAKNTEHFENHILELLPIHVQESLKPLSFIEKASNTSFKEAIGSIIDTIILRIMLRRFLEGYHGLDPFSKRDDFKDLGFGYGEGKMEDLLRYLAEVKYSNEFNDRNIKRASQVGSVEQLDLFEVLTAAIELKRKEEEVEDIYKRLRHQFELAYGGDLFASDVALATNRVEDSINKIDSKILLSLWADTSSDRFNFRYEDLPPDQIQHFYEDSMGHSLQLNITDSGDVFFDYTDDLQEKKHRGAYYTNHELVEYMVRQTVGEKVEESRKLISTSLEEVTIIQAIQAISKLSIVDLTCGGGSFLRGAFRYLSSKRSDIVRTIESIKDDELREKILQEFPYFENQQEAETLWEKHILLNMVFGIDIDYKALIISSQTLTLSALQKWQPGHNFPQLMGLTLMHHNSLIYPVKTQDRIEVFERYRHDIKELRDVRNQLSMANEPLLEKQLHDEFTKKRLILQEKVCSTLVSILGEYQDALMPQAIEINFPHIFFDETGEYIEGSGFDVCIGNPPWEAWKANAEEFFENYSAEFRQSKKQEKLKLIQAIYSKVPHLKEKWDWLSGYYAVGSRYFLHEGYYDFQRIQIDGKFTGSDINLYKIALERSYQTLSKSGVCGLLVPANVYLDQGSTGLRTMLFNHTQLKEIASFENRKKIFSNVDGRQKFAILLFTNGGITQSFRAFFYKLSVDALKETNKQFIEISRELIEKTSPELLSVPEIRTAEEVNLLNKLNIFPFLGEKIEDKWNIEFISELHMANDSHLFNTEQQGYTLYEGKRIWQYSNQFSNTNYFVGNEGKLAIQNKEIRRLEKVAREHTGIADTKDALKATFGKPIVPLEIIKLHSEYYRIAFREVSSSTNKRTVVTTVIPKNVFCAHTLVLSIPARAVIKGYNQVEYTPSYSSKQMVLLVGLMNSFVVDFILRRKVDKHVTMFLIYQTPIPRLTDGDQYFSEIVERAAKLICTNSDFEELRQELEISGGVEDAVQRQLIQNQIDAYVAKIYGINRDELLYILSTFKSANHKVEMEQIAQGVIEQFDLLEKEGELKCPE